MLLRLKVLKLADHGSHVEGEQSRDRLAYGNDVE